MLIILAVLLLIALIVSYIAFRIGLYYPLPHPDEPHQIPKSSQHRVYKSRILSMVREMEALPYEQVYITSYDGLRLFGRYYHVKDGAPVEIQFHGYKGNAFQDLCAINRVARNAGRNTIVVDQRAHGKSDGQVIGMGTKERFDCQRWAKYAEERFGADTPLILSGVSMGGGTVLMASDLELPQSVRCIVADCPFSSPLDIMRKMTHDKPAKKLIYPFALIGAVVFGHVNMRSSSPVLSVPKAKVPILLIHGQADKFVPPAMSAAVEKACTGYVRRELFPKAGHNLSAFSDYPRYEKLINEFVDDALRCKQMGNGILIYDTITYDETHQKIVEDGINSIKEVLFGDNIHQIRQLLFCLDLYLDPYYGNRLPYEKEVYDLLQELVVTSQDDEIIYGCLSLIESYACVPLTIMEQNFAKIKDSQKPYAKYILEQP